MENTVERLIWQQSDGQRLSLLRITQDVVMPTDTSALADWFRAANAGKRLTHYEARGIKYASGPRWDAPTVATSYGADPYDATTFKRVAWQTYLPIAYGGLGWRDGDGRNINPGDPRDFGVVMDEDSGLLDIYTTRMGRGVNQPTIIEFHGGGHTKQPRTLPRFAGDRMRGATYVVPEFPLSTYGWFSANAFGSGHQPNVAYQYMIAVLEWVQANIAEFGGDPNNVMITGASSGGADCIHLIPSSAGLFHRVLAHDCGGGGTRPSAYFIRQLGDDFWRKLRKNKPAWYDPSRTIQQIADSDGVAAALRLGPSPAQIMAWGNERTSYTFDGSGFSTSTRADVNRWPVRDGSFVANDTALREVIADRWPSSMPVWITWAANEASAHDDGAGDITPILARVGINTDPDIAYCRDVLFRKRLDALGDKWSRQAVGYAIYGYFADRMIREHTANGGRGWIGYFDWRTSGNGSERPGHATQVAYYNRKPWWQVSQGQTANTSRLTVGDLLLAEHLARSAIAFAKDGDPASDYVAADDPGLFMDSHYQTFEAWSDYGAAQNVNTIRCDFRDPQVPAVIVGGGPYTDARAFFDSKIGY